MKSLLPHLRGLLPARDDIVAMRQAPRADLLAGLTVSVVALPLALGFGAASGMSPAAGLITAVIAGFVAAMMGGSNLQVSGPTGAMTVVLIPITAEHGPSGVLTVALMAGVILLLLALLKAGRYMNYIPVPVIEGFTVGIAVTIFLQQLPAATGVNSDSHHVVIAAGEVITSLVTQPQWANVALALGVMVIMLVGKRRWPSIPFSLVAIVIATVITYAAGLDVALIGALPHTIPAPSLEFLNISAIPSLIPAAMAVAALAALESLLCATVADKMHGSQRHAPDRELFGQGVANLASPLFGGIPATAAIARTAVNVRSGANSRAAAAWHAVVLAIFMLVAAPIVEQIPLAALAGVLFATSIGMVNHTDLRNLARSTRSDGIIMVLTAIATVALDLIMGVAIGLAVAGIAVIVKVATSLRVHPQQPESHDHHDEKAGVLTRHVGVYHLHGPLVFASSRRILAQTETHGEERAVILDLQNLTIVDASGALALGELAEDLARRDVQVFISGLRNDHRETLHTLGILEKVEDRDHFEDASEAAAAARERLRSDGVM